MTSITDRIINHGAVGRGRLIETCAGAIETRANLVNSPCMIHYFNGACVEFRCVYYISGVFRGHWRPFCKKISGVYGILDSIRAVAYLGDVVGPPPLQPKIQFWL